MKKIPTAQLKNIDLKTVVKTVAYYYKRFNVVTIFVIAGLIIGFSLLRVKSFVTSVGRDSSIVSSTDEPLIKLQPAEETIERLEGIKSDNSIDIAPRLPSDRINPF